MLLNIITCFTLIASATAQICNGHAELCSRKYSNVTQVGTHDSAFVGVLPTQNQYLSVASQLKSGIRYLQAQSHLKDGTLELCHTTCGEEDSGTLLTYLTTIKTWMDANPNEVVSVLLTNGDGAPASQFGSAMMTSGLAAYAYSPGKKLAMNDWPTLGELIAANTRLVMFLDFGANTASVSYILDEFSYYFETGYDVTDKNFPSCALDRPSGSNGDGLMMIVNHFLDYNLFGILIPDAIDSPKTNAATGTGSVGAQADVCMKTWGRRPNVVLVDYFNTGNVFKAQDTLNGF